MLFNLRLEMEAYLRYEKAFERIVSGCPAAEWGMTNMTLTKYEKETIILFNEGEDTAHIQTYNAGLRKRLAAFSKKHPDLCRLEKSFAQGGVIYVLDKSRLSIRLQAPYSEERRRKASESAKQTGFKSRTE